MGKYNVQFSKDDKVAIWGKGMFIEETITYLERLTSVCCIIDNNSKLWGGGMSLGCKQSP